MITVIPTVDVEGVHGKNPFEQMILGHIGEKDSWGVFRLAKIFNEFGVRATFFVDVYEYTLWGELPIARICEQLVGMGQDVQLHTHPSWCEDHRDFKSLRELKKEKKLSPTGTGLHVKTGP